MLTQNLRNTLAALAVLLAGQLAVAQTDITSQYLTNPSFESGTDGWTVFSLNTQTNSYFTKKNGATYLETWVDRGGRIGNAEVSQVIKALPRGKYRLRAAGLHIQQRAANSEVNISAMKPSSRGYAPCPACWQMFVYDHEIVLRARDYGAHAWLPEFDAVIPL